MIKKTFIVPVMFAVLVGGIAIAWVGSRLYLYSPEFAGSHTYNLFFNSAPWAIMYSAGLGISLGAVAARFRKSESGTRDEVVVRRGAGLLFEDLGLAFCVLGVVVLLATGIMMGGSVTPRVLADSAGTIGFVMNVHFVGIVTLLFGVAYFVTRTIVSGDYGLVLSQLRGFVRPRRQSDYLPSLRWAMLAAALALVALGVKGTGLLAEQVLGLPREIAIVTSLTHDILGLVGVIPAGVAAILLIVESLGKQGRSASQPAELNRSIG